MNAWRERGRRGWARMSWWAVAAGSGPGMCGCSRCLTGQGRAIFVCVCKSIFFVCVCMRSFVCLLPKLSASACLCSPGGARTPPAAQAPRRQPQRPQRRPPPLRPPAPPGHQSAGPAARPRGPAQSGSSAQLAGVKRLPGWGLFCRLPADPAACPRGFAQRRGGGDSCKAWARCILYMIHLDVHNHLCGV